MGLNKLRQWMVGRYGMDALNRTLVVAYLLLAVLSLPFRRVSVAGALLLLASYALVLLVLFRMLSKNTAKRYEESRKFLAVQGRLRGMAQIKLRHLKERKDYHFYTCSQCRQKIRIPKGKGKICITCPKCRHEFIKKS